MRLTAAGLVLAFVIVAGTLARATAAEIRDLGSLAELRTLVDRDRSIPRLVLLLSPT